MFFLRLISFCAGCYAAFAGPFLLFSKRALFGGFLSVEFAGAGLAVVLFALVYFFFALFAGRIARSLRLRWLAAVLVAFQMLSGLLVLATSDNLNLMLATLPLLAVTAVLQLALVWPGDAGGARRTMRRRDAVEPPNRP